MIALAKRHRPKHKSRPPAPFVAALEQFARDFAAPIHLKANRSDLDITPWKPRTIHAHISGYEVEELSGGGYRLGRKRIREDE